MARIAIIADDLTGALDTASPFACHGLHVRAALDLDSLDEAIAARPDVLAVSTNSRDLPGDRAAALAGEAARQLFVWRPDLVLKKIDSRLKGNIAGETAAVAEVFGFSRMVAAPAVPDQGRLVRNGHVEGTGVDGQRNIAERMPCGQFTVSICDAASDDDLDRIAGDWRIGTDVLFVGARGLASAFARRFAGSGKPKPFIVSRPVMLAVGSRDPITAKQIATLLAVNKGAAIVEAPGGNVPASHASNSLTIFACKGDMTEPPALVATRFARSVAAEAARTNPSTMLLTGGDTALAVLQALGVRTLDIRGEAAAGLPWFEVASADGGTITVVSKSGGFGTEDILAKVLGTAGQ